MIADITCEIIIVERDGTSPDGVEMTAISGPRPVRAGHWLGTQLSEALADNLYCNGQLAIDWYPFRLVSEFLYMFPFYLH